MEAAFFAFMYISVTIVMEVEVAGQKSKNEIVEIPLEIVPETSSEVENPSQPADEQIIEAEIVQVN